MYHKNLLSKDFYGTFFISNDSGISPKISEQKKIIGGMSLREF